MWRRLGQWRKWLSEARRIRVRSIPRRKIRLTLLAKLQGVDEASVELLRELASTGTKFETLVNTPEWSALLELKEEMQAIATEQARASSATDQQRRDGALAYWNLEGLFGAVYRTIRNGQKARALLHESVKTK